MAVVNPGFKKSKQNPNDRRTSIGESSKNLWIVDDELKEFPKFVNCNPAPLSLRDYHFAPKRFVIS